MGRHLVVVGCGHAHMTLLLRLAEFTGRGHLVTVINPDPYHYYSGMGPGMLSGLYRPRQVRFHVKRMAEERGAEFIRDRAVRIDAANRSIILASGLVIGYDVASFNVGSDVPMESVAAVSERIFPVKPIINLYRARQEILRELDQRDLKLTVVGGGAAGVEVTANLWRLTGEARHRGEITLLAGTGMLARFPDRVRSLVVSLFEQRGIRLIEGARCRNAEADRTILSDGSVLEHDFAIMALGVRPPGFFTDSGLPVGEDGGMLVDSYLRCVAHPEIHGGGDCISLAGEPLAKVGVYAVRQNPVLLHNLMAALEGGALQKFDPGGAYLLIMNMGDGTGIMWKKELVMNGRSAFRLKDWIDRRFMRKFQVSGEDGEPDGEIV